MHTTYLPILPKKSGECGGKKKKLIVKASAIPSVAVGHLSGILMAPRTFSSHIGHTHIKRRKERTHPFPGGQEKKVGKVDKEEDEGKRKGKPFSM